MSEKNRYRLQTLLPAASIGLLTVAFTLAKTGRDALFFQGRGLLQLPMAYMGISLCSAPSDLFQNAPETVSASSFSQITASALAGGMTGGFLAKGLISYLKPKWLILVGAIAILIAAGVVIGTHRKSPMTNDY